MSPLSQIAMTEQMAPYALDRSLSLESNPGMDHHRNASLDAYDAVDLVKANSLEMRARKMAEELSTAEEITEITSMEDILEDFQGGESPRSDTAGEVKAAMAPPPSPHRGAFAASPPAKDEAKKDLASGAAKAKANAPAQEDPSATNRVEDAPLDSTLDSMPTSWSADFASEVRKVITLSGLKVFKSMEVSLCGQELSNCIIEEDDSPGIVGNIDSDLMHSTRIGESGEMEMTTAEVRKIFNKNIIKAKSALDALLCPPANHQGTNDSGGTTKAPGDLQTHDSNMLICRIGNVLIKWTDVSRIAMTYLAFHEYPEDCPRLVIPLQPSLPVNLSFSIIERAKSRQEEKWKFFSWLSSSFRTPDKSEIAQAQAQAKAVAAEAQDAKESAAAPNSAKEDGEESAPNGGSPSGMDHDAGAGSSSGMFTPTSKQLDMLNLKDGQNTVTFSCYSSLWGTQTATAYIYLMPWNSKVVVSDVDGTITKSDVLGHIMTAIGRDWSHVGVTKLMEDIRKNGYHVMYLSARSIGQATVTRDFLFNLDQNGAKLPVGPVIISPDGILPSLFREMILKRPDEFKIASLQTIRDLFPEDWHPFYAGFGNRPTDEISYSAVGIPTSRIFTINPKGQVALSSASQVKTSQWCTLQGINELVHDIFPELKENEADHVDHDKYSEYNFWKVPQAEIDVLDD